MSRMKSQTRREIHRFLSGRKPLTVNVKKTGKKDIRVKLANQIADESCSIGNALKRSQISDLGRQADPGPGGILEEFCMSCRIHGSEARGRRVFVWVGNSATQCPGQCAWPFHQPVYGPQNPPLGAPNGDVGIDGMVLNVASLLAGAVTNPFGNGYFQESASACAGVYGKGAYPGYACELLVDSATGASYNAQAFRI